MKVEIGTTRVLRVISSNRPTVQFDHATREEQNARYLDCGPQAWDDRGDSCD